MKDASGLESWSGTFFFQFQDYYLEDHPRTCNKWLVTPRWSWFMMVLDPGRSYLQVQLKVSHGAHL